MAAVVTFHKARKTAWYFPEEIHASASKTRQPPPPTHTRRNILGYARTLARHNVPKFFKPRIKSKK
jgi:hypothetical protein